MNKLKLNFLALAFEKNTFEKVWNKTINKIFVI